MTTTTTLRTVYETANTLRCSTKSVRRYVATGELAAVRVGGRLLFDDADVRAFVRRRRVQPAAVPA